MIRKVAVGPCRPVYKVVSEFQWLSGLRQQERAPDLGSAGRGSDRSPDRDGALKVNPGSFGLADRPPDFGHFIDQHASEELPIRWLVDNLSEINETVLLGRIADQRIPWVTALKLERFSRKTPKTKVPKYGGCLFDAGAICCLRLLGKAVCSKGDRYLTRVR